MSKSYSELFHGTIGESATVWDNITPTQPNYPDIEIPQSFILKTENGILWVHGNATEHMADYLIKQVHMGYVLETTRLSAQLLLYDMQQSLSAVLKNGFSYGQIISYGNWEFIIRKPRNDAPYDAVIHALIKK